jgi:hypothetical protein
MRCESYRDALTEVALGSAPSPEVEAHLASCAGCREKLEADRRLLGRIEREITATLDTKPSQGFWFRVGQRASERPRARTSWFPAWALAATAVVVVAVLSARLLQRPEPPVPASPGREPSEAPSRRPEAARSPLGAPEAAGSAREAREVARVEPRPAARTAARAVTARTTAPARSSGPEVLVPPGQEALARRLAQAVRQGRVDGESIAAPPVAMAEVPSLGMSPIEVRPIGVLPLTIRPIEDSNDFEEE